MKKIISLIITLCFLNSHSQTLNFGFETGDFTNWVGYEGYNANSDSGLTKVTGPINSIPVNLNSSLTSCDYFSIIHGGTDSLMNVSLTSPFGGYCARLGNPHRNIGANPYGCSDAPSGSYTNTAGEDLYLLVNVNPGEAIFQYAFLFCYADNGTHPNGSQPYFKVELFDQMGDTLSCYQNTQSAYNTVALAGYAGSDSIGMFYTPNWNVVSLNLLPYLGQYITIHFTVAGCTQTGHFGYAYVDCKASPFPGITATSMSCIGTTLNAPPLTGATYTWSGPGIVGVSNTQSISINQSGTYSVTETLSCGTLGTFDTTITLHSVANNTLTVCDNYPIGTHIYYVSGNYIDTLQTTVGCDSIVNTQLTVNPLPSAIFTLTADASPHIWDAVPSISSGASPYTYLWSWGDGTTDNNLYTSHTYSAAAHYDVCLTVTDANGCSNQYCENDSLYRTSQANQMVQINVQSATSSVSQISSPNSQPSIYPNPANTTLNIVISSSSEMYRELSVTDVLGNKANIPINPFKGGMATLDVSSLSSGVYFVRVGTSTQKFIKQ